MIKLEGKEHNDITVTFNEVTIPKEFYSLQDSNVVLNQDGHQFIKSLAKQAYYAANTSKNKDDKSSNKVS